MRLRKEIPGRTGENSPGTRTEIGIVLFQPATVENFLIHGKSATRFRRVVPPL